MIHINRDRVKKPEILEQNADVEHTDAHTYYTVDNNEKAYNHTLFKNEEVKKALEQLFNGKCAYCESKVMKTSAIDKEHFRPKTSVKNKANKTTIRGYYWLAADWDNLFLACPHCNRTGTHETIDGEEFVSGKLDYFPLSDEKSRVGYGQALEREEKVRLLINPCIENPEKIIQYNEDGEILPLLNISGRQEAMVKESVEIFGLQRSQLHKDRKEKWLVTQSHIIRIKEYYKDFLRHKDAEYLDRLRRELDELNKSIADDKEHLGVSRFVIRTELLELKEIISGLEEK